MKKMRKPRRSNSDNIDTMAPASIVVTKFGGLGKMAHDTGIATSTIWGWMRRGDIPPKRVPDLKAHAMRLKVKLKDSDFVRGMAVAANDHAEDEA